LKVRFDAGRPAGRAFELAVKQKLGVLRDLTRRAERAGIDLPPVLIKGNPSVQSRRIPGFGKGQILYATRASILLMPRKMIVRFESQDEDSEEWKPTEGMMPLHLNLPRFFADRAVRKHLLAADVTKERLEIAFDRWTQIIDAGTGPRLKIMLDPAHPTEPPPATKRVAPYPPPVPATR
jgi:hypothetical protein